MLSPLTLLSIVLISVASACRFNSDRLPAKACNQYFECEVASIFDPDKGYNLVLKTCPDDTKFDRNAGYCRDLLVLDDDCMPITTEETTQPSVAYAPEACTYHGKRLQAPVSCRHYYSCKHVDKNTIGGYKKVLESCPMGLTFDRKYRKCDNLGPIDPYFCVPLSKTSKKLATTPRTTAISTKACRFNSDRLPAKACNQYFECDVVELFNSNKGFTLHLKTCPGDTKFDRVAGYCRDLLELDDDCKPRTRKTKKRARKTSVTSYSPEPCTYLGERFKTSASCRHYYSCEATDIDAQGLYKKVLKACPKGLIFDRKHRKCKNFGKIDHYSCLPLSKTTKKQATHETRTPVPKVSEKSSKPVCTKRDKFPAASCEQYYQCRKTKNRGWTAVLKSCGRNLFFNPLTKKCADSNFVNCETTESKILQMSELPTLELRGVVLSSYADELGTLPGGKKRTTTTEENITTKPITIPPPISKDRCTSVGLVFPGPKKNQYWKCIYIWQKYVLELQTCRFGQLFDSKLKKCYLPK